MPTRNVVLTAHQETLIEGLTRAGRYQNASEVLRERLRLIEERDAREATKLRAPLNMTRTGFTDLDEGRYRDATDDALDEHVAALGGRVGHQAQGTGP